MCFSGSQALLLFFSSSAAALCHGIPDHTLRLSESDLRPAPGSGRARSRARARSSWGMCWASSDPGTIGGAGLAGPRLGPDRVWWRGPDRVRTRLAFGGFDGKQGRLLGLPTPRCRASPVLSSPFGSLRRHVFQCLRMCCFVVDAWLSGSLAAPRGLCHAGPSALLFTPSSALARTASSPAGAAGCE